MATSHFARFDTTHVDLLDEGLRYGRIRQVFHQGFFLDPSETLVLADVPGSGIVRSIWMAVAFNGESGDQILRVFVDGETTPAIDVDLGSLLATHHSPATGDRMYGNAHAHALLRSDGALGFVFRMPMPFSNGIRIEINNPTAGLAVIYSQVAYQDDVRPPNYRLRSQGVKRTTGVVLPAANTYEFFNLPAGSGWLAWSGYSVLGTVTDGSWVERNWEVYQGTELLISSSGTEDWFGGAFSHMTQAYAGTDVYMIGANNATTQYDLALDLVRWYGGIRFDDGVRCVLGTEAGVATQHTFCWCWLYYLHT